MKKNYATTPAICFGKILWDLRPDKPKPIGAPLNIACHLNKLGVDTSLISQIGQDDNAWPVLNNATAVGAFIATEKGGCPNYKLLGPV